MKKFFLVGLIFLFFESAFAQENLIEPLPWSSLEELYQAVAEFSQQELGIPIDYQILPQDTSQTATLYFYALMVCHKLKFWDETTPLCSLYVYGDTCRYSTDVLLQYNLGEYDIWGFKIAIHSTTWSDKQVMPVFDLSNIDLFVSNLSTVFHEAFHYHAWRTKAAPNDSHLVTIKNRALEESAAEFIGWQATGLFIKKYCSNNSLVKQIYDEFMAIENDYADFLNYWYQSLDAVYCSNLSDSQKFDKRMESPIDNACLNYTILYYRYQPLYKKIWDQANTKTSIEKILEILSNDTKTLKKIK